MSATGKFITESLLNNPNLWTHSEYTSQHISGLEIWTANLPIFDISVYSPCSFSLSIIDKVKIYFALRRAKALKINNMLTVEQESK